MVADLLKYRHGVEVSRRHLPEAPGGLWRLSEDSAGNVWICTERRGVIQVPPEGTPRRWTSTNGLASSNARFVFEDREKTLWVGTSGGGLSRFSERRFQGHGSENGLPEPVVDSVWPAGGGDLWIGTRGKGLFRLHDGAITNVPLPVTDRALYVQSVMTDRAGRTWVGTSQDLWISDAGGFRRVHPDLFPGSSRRQETPFPSFTSPSPQAESQSLLTSTATAVTVSL